MTNSKEFAAEWLDRARRVYDDAEKVDPKADEAGMEQKLLETRNNSIKQMNNTLKTILKHDVASREIQGYVSSVFMDENGGAVKQKTEANE